MSYAALWCKSNYSFLEGASHPEELVERAHFLGLQAIAITDRHGVYGIVRAHVRAQELGLKLLCGTQLTLSDSSTLVLLAQNREGYTTLCQLLTKGHQKREGGFVLSEKALIASSRGLLALWSGPRDSGAPWINQLKEAYGDRLYLLVARHRLAEESALEQARSSWAAQHGIPAVASNEVLYHHAERRPLQDILSAIRCGRPLATMGTALRANAEHDLKSPSDFRALYRDRPYAVDISLEIAARASFSLLDIRYVYPSEGLPNGQTSFEWLRQLGFEGAYRRYGTHIPAAVRMQLDRELRLIDELDYTGYFLTMWEIVRFCREKKILCQGRGSAANSTLCYCLGITAVDPIKMDLLFERFLSRERKEPPDIDLDIEHERREEVIRYTYQKYGKSHAAMVATVIRYRKRSAIRDVGKALGLDPTVLGKLAQLAHRDDGEWADQLALIGADPQQRSYRHLVGLVDTLCGMPRHLSIHPGGFLLGHEPITTMVPIQNGAMAGRTIIQWDKNDIEALGLFKVDLLGLGALSMIRRALDLLRIHKSQSIDMASIPAEDRATYEMCARGDTVGVFQIESRAQMAMLPRLKPRTFYDLVVQVAIVRPGPIAGNMVHPYLRRRSHEEAVTYPHSCLRPVLEKTLGVPLFQEQVMRLAIVAADYNPGEADQLRRDMGAWKLSGNIERHRDRLISRMRRKGIPKSFAERVFKEIRGFGEYGFPESHAASFALIAYASAWLKCHHPAVFFAALLNAQPMGFYSVASLIEDAKRHQVVSFPIDVQHSAWDCTLEALPIAEESRPLALRMGLRYVKGLPEVVGESIALNARIKPFRTLLDVIRRGTHQRSHLCALAEAGAFRSLGYTRRKALWQIAQLSRGAAETIHLPEQRPAPVFKELSTASCIAWDYQRTRHSTHGHPLAPLRPLLRRQNLITSAEIKRMPHGERVRYAGLVICRQRPSNAAGVTFLTLEDESGFANLIIWAKVFETYRVFIKGEAFLGVTALTQRQKGVFHLVVEHVWRPLVHSPSELSEEAGSAMTSQIVQSRDFH